MNATVCPFDVHGVRGWGETEDEGRRRRDRDGAWRKETVNEAFLGSSEGLSTEEGKRDSFSLDLTRKTERDLS